MYLAGGGGRGVIERTVKKKVIAFKDRTAEQVGETISIMGGGWTAERVGKTISIRGGAGVIERAVKKLGVKALFKIILHSFH